MGGLGILVLLAGLGLAVVAFTRREPEVPGDGVPPSDGQPPLPPGIVLPFEPVLLGEPTVQVNPF